MRVEVQEMTKPQSGDIEADAEGERSGQGLAEYALILALIVLIAIITLIFLGSQVSVALSRVGASV